MKPRKPLKRRTPLKADPDKPMSRSTAIPKVNPKRKKKLHARNFGDEADFVRGFPCEVTGRSPVDAAHTKSRGAGGDRTMLVPLHREVHRSFDADSEAAFERKWGRTKQSVRDAAPKYNAAFREWKARNPEGMSF